MFKTILVPLDGSPLAERALPYAEALARASGGRLILGRAVPYLARPVRDRSYRTLAAARDAAAEEARLSRCCGGAAGRAGRGHAGRCALR